MELGVGDHRQGAQWKFAFTNLPGEIMVIHKVVNFTGSDPVNRFTGIPTDSNWGCITYHTPDIFTGYTGEIYIPLTV